MPYAILRFQKHGGNPARSIEAHHERKKEAYKSNPDIDPSRSHMNYHLANSTMSYYRSVNARIEAAGCRTRKNSVRFVDALVTASPDFFTSRTPLEVADYFNKAFAMLESRIGSDNIISAVVHMDEKTPHMHLCFVPITKDKRLSAKEIIGNRVGLTEWQDAFHAHLSAIWPELERGQPASETKRQHIPVRLFKTATKLDHQLSEIEGMLADINVFNAAKKRMAAIEALRQLLPMADGFAARVNRLKQDNDHLTQENYEARQSQNSAETKLYEMRREVQRYRDILERIPAEIIEEARNPPKRDFFEQPAPPSLHQNRRSNNREGDAR